MRRSHRKRPVAAQQNFVVSDRLDDGVEIGARVDKTVHVEAANGLDRREIELSGRAPGCRSALPTSTKRRQAAAAVGEDDLEMRKAMKDAGKDQVGRSNRRLDRIPEQISEIVRIQAAVGGRSRRHETGELPLA